MARSNRLQENVKIHIAVYHLKISFKLHYIDIGYRLIINPFSILVWIKNYFCNIHKPCYILCETYQPALDLYMRHSSHKTHSVDRQKSYGKPGLSFSYKIQLS